MSRTGVKCASEQTMRSGASTMFPSSRDGARSAWYAMNQDRPGRVAPDAVHGEAIAAPGIRDVDSGERYFNPHINVTMNADLRRFTERPPERPTSFQAIDPRVRATIRALSRIFTPGYSRPGQCPYHPMQINGLRLRSNLCFPIAGP